MTLIHSAHLVADGSTETDAWLRFAGDRIVARGTGSSWLSEHDDDVVDADGGILAPGFVDLHCHGGGGGSFDGDDAAIRDALATHRAHGTTRSVLSLVTARIPDLARQLGAIADLVDSDPLVLGSHLEGPFLDDAHRGAHDPTLLTDPQPRDVDALVEAGCGSVVQVTIAPERPGGLDAVDRFVAAGVRVAIGHTAASYDEALAAFDRGASLLTHAFNAVAGIHHRAPGPVGAALRHSHVTIEVINDGVHVHPAVVKMLFDAAPERVALITDAMSAAGKADGRYDLGGLAVTVTDRVARLVDGGAIAGSTLLLDEALRQAVDACGIPLACAVDALTRIPARAIGRDDLGSLAVGSAADAVLMSSALRVRRVWGAGREIG